VPGSFLQAFVMLLAKDIITEAYRLIGVVAEDEDPTPAQMARGLRTFGAMVKSFQVDQAMDWLSTDGWMTITPGKWIYFMGGHHLNMGFDFPNRPVELYDVHVTDQSGNDLRVEMLNAEDYHEIPDKETRGLPLRAYLDPQLGQARLYLWQVPDRQYLLKFRYQRELAIPKTENEYLEFPDEWQEMLEYNLATRLAAKNGVNAAEYSDVFQLAMKLDKEMKDRAIQGGEFVVRPDPGRWW
jgi:hypothetical protein